MVSYKHKKEVRSFSVIFFLERERKEEKERERGKGGAELYGTCGPGREGNRQHVELTVRVAEGTY